VVGRTTHAASPAIHLVRTAYAAGGAEAQGSVEGTLMVAAIVVALVGIFIAYYLYIKRTELPERFVKSFPGVFRTVNNKYYVDELYHAIFVRGLLGLGTFFKRVVDEILIDGTVNGIAYVLQGVGSLIRLIQAGYVQGYAFGMIAGAIALLGYLIIKVIL